MPPFIKNNLVAVSLSAVAVFVVLLVVTVQLVAPDSQKPFKSSKANSSSSSSSVSSSTSSSSSSSSSSVSSSSSSSSTSSSSSSVSVSSSSSSSSSTQVVQSGAKQMTYTNEYFPNFKLVYDDTWKFETSTSEGIYSNLLNRNIYLSKPEKNILLKLDLSVWHTSPCTGVPSEVITKFSNGVYKSSTIDDVSNKKSLFYGKLNACDPLIINTNIDTNNIKDYLRTNNQKTKVEYRVFISPMFGTLSTQKGGISINTQDPKNSNIISEIDKIIENSKFE